MEGGTPISQELWPELSGCFGCDLEHSHGLRLAGHLDADGVVRARWEARPEFTSWPGVVHGGILATLLDEATGWAANVAFRERDGEGDRRPVVTAEATVRYRSPALTGRAILVSARVAELAEEQAIVEGELAGEDGTTIATCRTRYVRLRDVPDWGS